nr:outer membrane beta-barrel protein [Helicobacter cetorum]
MVLCSMLGFNLSHALDESKLNELIEKKVKEVLAKQEINPKHKRVDRSGLFAGLGYSGMYSWNFAYRDSLVWTKYIPTYETQIFLERKNPSTILNGFNFKVGYQYIAPVRVKKMGFGVRGGFLYASRYGNYIEKAKYRYEYERIVPSKGILSALFGNGQNFGEAFVMPIKGTSTSFNGSAVGVSTYSFFIDFLHNVYENDKLFVGYFIGAGLGGESVIAGYLGNYRNQVAQFQGYGSLGLRMGDKHHTLELSASMHGDAPSCFKKKPKTCESVRVMQVKIPRGFFESYVTWSADYVYRF